MLESIQKVSAVSDLSVLKGAVFFQCFSCCEFTIHVNAIVIVRCMI